MRKNHILLAASALAAGLVLTATVGGAWAYFTTYTSASGGYAIELSNETRIEENYSDHTKRLVVSNDGTQPAYVRAMAFSGSQYPLTYEGADWQPGNDGYYYYKTSVAGIVTEEDGIRTTSSTSELLIKIEFPTDAEEGDEINVVVIYESVPVQYDADGNELSPQEADWSVELITGKTEGGNN